jgi:sugar lactone lactonase YvrE
MSWFEGVVLVAAFLWFISAVTQADTVFVSTWNWETPTALYRVDPTIGGLIAVATNVGTPGLDQGVCGHDGNLYFSQPGAHRIIRVNPDGSHMTPVADLSGREGDTVGAPDGPSFDSQGNLYFTTVAKAVYGDWKVRIQRNSLFRSLRYSVVRLVSSLERQQRF